MYYYNKRRPLLSLSLSFSLFLSLSVSVYMCRTVMCQAFLFKAFFYSKLMLVLKLMSERGPCRLHSTSFLSSCHQKKKKGCLKLYTIYLLYYIKTDHSLTLLSIIGLMDHSFIYSAVRRILDVLITHTLGYSHVFSQL